jgi:hypothetical protein
MNQRHLLLYVESNSKYDDVDDDDDDDDNLGELGLIENSCTKTKALS